MLPEAHCYLRMAGKRIDVTSAACRGLTEPIADFLHEEEIDPTQITNYKTEIHQQCLSRRIINNGGLDGRSIADIWKIREECIATLSRLDWSVTKGSRKCRAIPAFTRLVTERNSGRQSPSHRAATNGRTIA